MKKTYIQPSIEIVKIRLNHMVMASLTDTLTGSRNVPDYNPNESFGGDEEDEYDI